MAHPEQNSLTRLGKKHDQMRRRVAGQPIPVASFGEMLPDIFSSPTGHSFCDGAKN
jgi:hypothetical protein